jgi:hypothetical protein
MKTCNYSSFSGASFEDRYDAALLDRLGSELAHAYDDTLHATLPASLQELVRRLDGSPGGGHRQERCEADSLA